MSEYTINIELPPYLRQWLVYTFGGEPIVFPKASTERRIMEMGLSLQPYNAIPDIHTETSVAIAIPCFRYKPPKDYHYLPKAAKEELVKCIRNRFVIELWQDLHCFGYIGVRHDNLFWAWMTAHGIEGNETNWNSVAKTYQRQHLNYLARRRRKRK